MRNQREIYADLDTFDTSYKKLSRSNFDKVSPKMIHRGKEVDITEEIIYLHALRCLKEKRMGNLGWFWYFQEIFKDMNLDKKSALELDSKLIGLADEFDASANIILKSPDDILMLNSLKLSYISYKMEYNRKEIYKWAIDVALGYLQSVITHDKFSINELYNYAQEDEICKLCIYSVLAWLCTEGTKVPKDRGLVKTIHKYAGESLDQMLENENLKFKEVYLEYKDICIEDYSDEQRDEFWKSKREYILSDLGRLDASKFGTTSFKYDITCDSEYILSYNRSVADSFKNCYSKWYPDITDIPDDKSREIIFNLIQRYLGDIDEVISAETLNMIRQAISYGVLLNDLKLAKEQNVKDLEKVREQNKIKVNKVKKELDQAKEQLAFSKDKVNRLTKELKKTDKEAVIELEAKVSKLEEDNAQLRKKHEKHQLESERLNNKIEQLEKELRQAKRDKDDVDRELRDLNSKTLDNKEDETKFSFQSKEIDSDVLYNAIKHKKILLVGGNKIHARIIERGYDNIELLKSDNVNITMHAGQKYDLVVIYTKLVSHSVVERIESELKNSDIPIIRFNQAGINTLLYTIFMYIYGGYDEAVGKYIL